MNPHLAPHPANDEVREDLGSQSMKPTSPQEVFVLPASPQQRRYREFADAYPESRVWNVAARWSLRGPLQADALERALNAVCARHEALRTCLGLESGEIVQKILPDLKLTVPIHDLRALAAAEKSPESDRRATEEAKTAFELEQWPLVRFQLLRLEDEHYILLVSAHHAVADGWSIGTISRDMAAFYAAILAGNSATVSDLPVQFADFAIWQNESLQNGAFHPQLAYWKKQLRGLVPLRIPGDLPGSPAVTEQTWNGAIVSQLLPRSLSDALAQASQRFGATLFSTALAALYIIMHGFSGRKDLSIGTQVAGRNRVEIENAVGVFSNALVLRTRLSRESSFASLASSVAEMVIQATTNQEVPYETVLQSMIANAHLGKSRLYYVNFIYQRSFIENIKFADIQLTDLPSRSPGAPYDLNFFMVERPEGWRLSLEYNTDMYSSALAENLLERFAEILGEVAVNPEVKISELKTLHVIEQTPDRENVVDECLILPASTGQQRYWVLDQLGQKSSSFKMPIRWRLKGKIDADTLELAFNEVVRRNEIMRTTLIEIDGQPMQRVASALTVTIPRFDLRDVPGRERQNEVERIADAVGEGQFNMSSLPLIHAALVQLEDGEYVFCLTVHPIVCDGLAVGLLAKELFDIYDALVGKLPHALPEPDLQYGDYAIWQREFVQSPAMQEQIQYWLSQLKNYQPFEVMPDKPRPPLQTTNGAFLSLQLPKTLTDAVQDLSKKRGNSFFITAFAAFLTLLYRYTGQEDISVGTEVSGRNQTEHEQIIGLFLNTLVLRNNLSGDPRFPELMERVQDVVMQAIANQDVPFQKVVEIVNPQRDPSRKPLFQVNFMLQRSTVSNRDYDTFSLIDIPSKPLGALFDLNWLMVERANGWRVAIQYNTDLFESHTVERMLAHFHELLEEVAARPDQRISEFEILTNAEQSLLAKWNDTNRVLEGRTIHELFEAQAAKSPTTIAVTHGKEQWTYSELNYRANQFAHYLREQGVTSGVRVGLCVERSEEMVAALLAILKAGGAYIPLDPSYPVERLRYMLKDSEPALLITQAELSAWSSDLGVKTYCIDSEWKTIANEPGLNLSRDVGADSEAYVIYTSGSMGNPKGVTVPHRAVVNLLESMRVEPGIRSTDILVAVTTLSFDIAALELFLPLATGARVVIASREQAQDGVQLLALLQHSKATMLQATPATWRILLDAGWSGNPRLKMLCGGETLSGTLANELLATGGELWNLYGPTETTIWSSIARISEPAGPICIGRPIANTSFYVLGPARNLTPIGAAGELYIAGSGVSSGYLNHPELTKTKFVADPFNRGEGACLYRTGDLVRWRSNGELEFLNRLDGQVKIRGFRVEPGEIEATLAQHPNVREAALVAVPDPHDSGSPPLIAYVVAKSWVEREPQLLEDLQSHLRKTLPDYMQPSAFVRLDALPRTANGKIDRKTLIARASARESTVLQQVNPTNPTEERMASIWENVLGISGVSTNANFFDLGGHSLLAARLMTKLEQEFGKRIPLAILFQSPTIQQLSRVIIGEISPSLVPGIVPIQPQGDKAPFFCVNGWSEMRRLALELGLDRPFLALNIPEGKTLTAPYTVREIAAHQIATMKTIQPEGPYYLGGWCRAGVIAYEIAQQLSAKGEEVGLVVLFESWSPTHLSRYPKKKARRARRSLELWRLKVHVGNLLHMNIGEAQAYARERLGNLWTRVMRILTHTWYNFKLGVAHSTLGKLRSKDEIMDLAATNYKPAAYQGRIILFRANEYHTWKYWDPTLGWGDYLPNLEVHEVPGRHESAAFFTGPYAVSTAREIRLAIDESCRSSKSGASPAMAR